MARRDHKYYLELVCNYYNIDLVLFLNKKMSYSYRIARKSFLGLLYVNGLCLYETSLAMGRSRTTFYKEFMKRKIDMNEISKIQEYEKERK